MGEGQNGSISKPKSKHTRIQGIDEKPGGKRFQHIVNAEIIDMHGSGSRLQRNFFKEKEINTQSNQKTASPVTDEFFMLQQARNPFRKYIAENNQNNITQPNACYKTESTLMAVGEALLDDGKNNRTNR